MDESSNNNCNASKVEAVPERRFECDICSRTFSRQHRLDSHFRSHSWKKRQQLKTQPEPKIIRAPEVLDVPNTSAQTGSESATNGPAQDGVPLEETNNVTVAESCSSSGSNHSGDTASASSPVDLIQKLGYTASEYINDCDDTYDEFPFKCPECQKLFTSRCFLNRHLLTHTKEKPFKCDICNKGFSQMGNLKVHLVTHSGQRRHQCYVCGKGFTQLGGLKAHLGTHSLEKAHSCGKCGKGFTSRCFLDRHLLTHSKEKPFVCDVCNKGFSQMGNLKVHQQTHLYTCTVCDKSFSKLNQLDRHYQIH